MQTKKYPAIAGPGFQNAPVNDAFLDGYFNTVEDYQLALRELAERHCPSLIPDLALMTEADQYGTYLMLLNQYGEVRND